jgi:hypothetical protein
MPFSSAPGVTKAALDAEIAARQALDALAVKTNDANQEKIGGFSADYLEAKTPQSFINRVTINEKPSSTGVTIPSMTDIYQGIRLKSIFVSSNLTNSQLDDITNGNTFLNITALPDPFIIEIQHQNITSGFTANANAYLSFHVAPIGANVKLEKLESDGLTWTDKGTATVTDSFIAQNIFGTWRGLRWTISGFSGKTTMIRRVYATHPFLAWGTNFLGIFGGLRVGKITYNNATAVDKFDEWSTGNILNWRLGQLGSNGAMQLIRHSTANGAQLSIPLNFDVATGLVMLGNELSSTAQPQSANANGYEKSLTGMIREWFSATVATVPASGTASMTITLPTAYTAAIYGAQVSTNNSSITAAVTAISTTSVTVELRNNSTLAAQNNVLVRVSTEGK